MPVFFTEVPVQVLATLLPIQLSTSAPGKAAQDSPPYCTAASSFRDTLVPVPADEDLEAQRGSGVFSELQSQEFLMGPPTLPRSYASLTLHLKGSAGGGP